jgi:hypothetical protein
MAATASVVVVVVEVEEHPTSAPRATVARMSVDSEVLMR